jgi:peroxiredoxin Q/BCP
VEGQGFRDRIQDFEQRGTTILGASFDSVAENAAFAAKFAFPFPLLCDTGRTLGMAYGACDSPDAGHARRISILIDEAGKVLRIYDPVRPAEHPHQVLADLDALAASAEA